MFEASKWHETGHDFEASRWLQNVHDIEASRWLLNGNDVADSTAEALLQDMILELQSGFKKQFIQASEQLQNNLLYKQVLSP